MAEQEIATTETQRVCVRAGLKPSPVRPNLKQTCPYSVPQFKRSERGQSFVEFSIVVVFLVMLVAGVADLGRAFFSYLSLQDAAQEGATYASVYPTWCYRTNVRVRDTLRNFGSLTVQVSIDNVLACQDGTVTNAGALTGACVGKEVRVMVRQNDYEIATPFIGAIFGTQTVALSASAIDYVLRPICP